MFNREETLERLNCIIEYYRNNPPKNDKEKKQLKEAKKNLAHFQQLKLF